MSDNDQDVLFFIEHPGRRSRIRKPAKALYRDQQRRVAYLDECELQFRQLGAHDPKRRYIIAYCLPPDHPTNPNHILRIPYIARSDETIEDRDDVLTAVVQELMVQEAMR